MSCSVVMETQRVQRLAKVWERSPQWNPMLSCPPFDTEPLSLPWMQPYVSAVKAFRVRIPELEPIPESFHFSEWNRNALSKKRVHNSALYEAPFWSLLYKIEPIFLKLLSRRAFLDLFFSRYGN